MNRSATVGSVLAPLIDFADHWFEKAPRQANPRKPVGSRR
jgi:hypothetical protein